MGDWDQAEGKLKETEGKLTGDEVREGQGKAEGAWADVKEKADDAWESVKDRFDGDDEEKK